MNNEQQKPHVVVIGAGLTGLAAAYELTRRGIAVTVIEKDEQIGGLAASFKINGQYLEKFYHHCFKNDQHVIQLLKELDCQNQLLYRPARTGIYLDNKIYKLCTPLDVLKFTPLSFLNRIRLGLLVLKTRQIKDFRQLESLTAKDWLLKLCGPQVYKVVWEPLLRGKFGIYADQISAPWFWSKLMLRGQSRGKAGEEILAYYCNGFAALIKTIADKIQSAGGLIKTKTAAEALIVKDNCIEAVKTANGTINAQAVIATPALPIIADLIEPHCPNQYIAKLRSIEYLANVCLVLELSQNLSDIYWLNVNDPDFPFVGVIEHTNFQPIETYGGRHIVYLSKYLPPTAELYQMNKEQLFEFSLPHIKRMFPKFDKSQVNRYHIFKAHYAQPIVTCNYSNLVPSNETPVKGLYLATMAQIYPEDRGINFAIRDGKYIAQTVATRVKS